VKGQREQKILFDFLAFTLHSRLVHGGGVPSILSGRAIGVRLKKGQDNMLRYKLETRLRGLIAFSVVALLGALVSSASVESAPKQCNAAVATIARFVE
jgi:hypothetical protein